MKYKAKLSKEAIEEIRKLLGTSEGILHIGKGNFFTESHDTVIKLSENYEVISVNRKEFQKWKDSCLEKFSIENLEKKDWEFLTRDEVHEIIGDLQIGSIVKMRYDVRRPVHLVITDLYENGTFDAMSIDIRTPPNQIFQKEGIILEKNVSVIYRNVNYRDITRVVPDRFLGFSLTDILPKGSRIEGRIVDKSKLEEILLLKNQLDEQVKEQEESEN